MDGMAEITLRSSDWLLEIDIVATSDLKFVALVGFRECHHIVVLSQIFIQLKH
jgi:hypothetical protein